MEPAGKKILHPILTPEERRRLFQEGIDLFNRGEFFEAHETWEEIWRSNDPEPRELFQGLIQVAAALHQFRDLKRRTGPRITFAKARGRLEPYAPQAKGLEIGELLRTVGAWQEWLENPEGDPPQEPRLRVVDPEAVR